MKDIREALAKFWDGFYDRSTLPHVPLKAYPTGYAVEFDAQTSLPPELPYITYDISRQPFGGISILTGRIWTRSVSWGLVDDVLEQAAKKVPECGTQLDLGDNGTILLYRSSPFLSYLPNYDERMKKIMQLPKAGAIRLVAKFFIH